MIQIIKQLIIICLLINILNCKEEKEIRNTNLPEVKEVTLSDKILQEAKWNTDAYGKLVNLTIIFQKDNNYRIDFNGEGCGQYWSGKYIIRNEKQVLLKKGFQQSADCVPDEPEKICEFRKEKNPILYEYSLNCGDVHYWDHNKPVSLNKESLFHDILVLSMSGKQGVTTKDVKLRERPNISSKFFNCRIEDKMLNNEERPFVPKETGLSLLFKTKNKEKIKDWENYWYFVRVNTGWYGRCDSENNLGWIFGEFVKEDN